MTVQQTLVFLKPDAVVRRYTGARLLKELTREARVEHYEVVDPGAEFLAGQHYAEHEGRFFFEWLIEYVSSAPVHVLILEGDGIIEGVRTLLGDTVPDDADIESLRGRYGLFGGLNAVHASDGEETANDEIGKWDPLLDSDLDSHRERLEAYVESYLDYPQVDPERYREVNRGFGGGELDREAAKSTFATLVARESDVSSAVVAEFAEVMMTNAELER